MSFLKCRPMTSSKYLCFIRLGEYGPTREIQSGWSMSINFFRVSTLEARDLYLTRQSNRSQSTMVDHSSHQTASLRIKKHMMTLYMYLHLCILDDIQHYWFQPQNEKECGSRSHRIGVTKPRNSQSNGCASIPPRIRGTRK